MRVTSRSWDGEKVFLRDQVLEVRRHDEWDPPIEPYDPYGPGDETAAAIFVGD